MSAAVKKSFIFVKCVVSLVIYVTIITALKIIASGKLITPLLGEALWQERGGGRDRGRPSNPF
jgi:hypothetical protein